MERPQNGYRHLQNLGARSRSRPKWLQTPQNLVPAISVLGDSQNGYRHLTRHLLLTRWLGPNLLRTFGFAPPRRLAPVGPARPAPRIPSSFPVLPNPPFSGPGPGAGGSGARGRSRNIPPSPAAAGLPPGPLRARQARFGCPGGRGGPGPGVRGPAARGRSRNFPPSPAPAGLPPGPLRPRQARFRCRDGPPRSNHLSSSRPQPF